MMTMRPSPIDGDTHPMTAALYDAAIRRTPSQERYLSKSFAERTADEMALSEAISRSIFRIADDDVAAICTGYDWTCGMMKEEDLYFRRNGTYRLKTAAEAFEQVYSQPDVMEKYLDGILASQLFWLNHLQMFAFYKNQFLKKPPPEFGHCEIGPGHGLYLQAAAAHPRCAAAVGCDISASAVDRTRAALARLGASDRVTLRQADLFDAGALDGRRFDMLCMSEIIEHLDDPRAALEAAHGYLAPGGRIFVNAPANSPAIDHVFLFETPEAVTDMVRAAGFRIDAVAFAPMAGYTLDRARALKISISCGVIATAH